jgi:hypothetical protein
MGEGVTFLSYWFSDVKQTEIQTEEQIVPEPSAFEAEMAI